MRRTSGKLVMDPELHIPVNMFYRWAKSCATSVVPPDWVASLYILKYILSHRLENTHNGIVFAQQADLNLLYWSNKGVCVV